jgi:cephalosporin-C deacetylase-like acetyl esterase
MLQFIIVKTFKTLAMFDTDCAVSRLQTKVVLSEKLLDSNLFYIE